MAPALLPGDWLLLDPTGRRWPRAGSIVVVREPDTGIVAIKRVAARGRRGTGAGAGGGGRAGGAGGGAARAGHTGRRAAMARGAGGRVASAPVGLGRPLEPREAWLLGDARDGSIDSRTYGPLDADAFVARAWFRYGPPRRIGRLR